MISIIEINNYKSIENINLDLGRVNLFIGENGAGKSNILEAIALAGAAAAKKLDNEFLSSRGIRLTKPEFMRSAFNKVASSTPISIKITDDTNSLVDITLENENSPYSKWESKINYKNEKIDFDNITKKLKEIIRDNLEKGKTKDATSSEVGEIIKTIADALSKISDIAKNKKYNEDKDSAEIKINPKSELQREIADTIFTSLISKPEITKSIEEFLIYSPENSSLRLLEKEGQIEPLGINGEGLLRLLHFYSSPEHSEILDEIKSPLRSLGWFENFSTGKENNEEKIILKDKYLDIKYSDFDQKSANEGFLFLLFYFCLFNSKLTPSFFAVDNIDASLNPKLCLKLTSELVKIAKKSDKQVILTTHNPAVLDGLNLDDDEQRLFVISRSRNGATKIRRIMKPMTKEGAPPFRLSELFLRGSLGGLPKGF